VKVVLPGGSGEIGTVLTRALAENGHEVVVLSRGQDGKRAAPARLAHWDGATVGPWAEELEGADAVVNLAGRSVNCRYNAANRREIMDSRIVSTRAVGRAIAACAEPPATWLQASTATIYAHRYDAANDEQTGILGGSEPDVPETWRFSIDVAQSWEHELENADTPRTRKVAMRSAIVMSPERDGTFDVLLGLVRRGLGGTAGNGRQYVSWVHHEDFARAVMWLIEHDDLAGPVNIAAPNPLPNATRWMLEVGAVFLRTETELLLKSRRVVSGRLSEAGFEFQHPTWPEAAQDLCEQWRRLDTQAGKSESP
jgi:uncharacterized protein (TIGR01777 family)